MTNREVIGEIFRKQPKPIRDYIKKMEAVTSAADRLTFDNVTFISAAQAVIEIRKAMFQLETFLEDNN